MGRKTRALLRIRSALALGFAILGISSCGVGPSGIPGATQTQAFLSTTSPRKSPTETPTRTLTSIPTLTSTPTQTRTPLPLDEWVSLGPEEGGVNDIVWDPAAPDTLYAASYSAGVFKSVNGGEEWRSINGGFASTYVRKILLDPQVTSTLYVLTDLGGIYKTVDGGENWKDIYPVSGYSDSAHSDNPRLHFLAIDPARPSTLFAINGNYQLKKSTNGGMSWTTANPSLESLEKDGSWTNFLSVGKNSPTTLFLGTSKALYKSVDEGKNWTETGIAGDMAFLVEDPGQPSTLYAGCLDGGLFESTDGGSSWDFIQNGGFFVRTMSIDPANPSTFYAITRAEGWTPPVVPVDEAVEISLDRGRHWKKIFQMQGNGIFSIAKVIVSPQNLFAATSLGVYKSVNGGADWTAINAGLSASSINEIAVDPENNAIMYTSTAGHGILKSIDGGDNWISIRPEFPDDGMYHPTGMVIKIDPMTPDIIYMTEGVYTQTLYKSIDGGLHWMPCEIEKDGFRIEELEIDPVTPTTLYANLGYPWQDDNYTFWTKSSDGGKNWTRIFEPPRFTQGNDLLIDPTTPTILYAATDDGIYKSTSGGEDWFPINTGITELTIVAVYLDPTNHNKLYALAGLGDVYASEDGGESWREIIPNLPETRWIELALDPINPNVVYAATINGVFRSVDGGWKWTAMNTGLKTLHISEILFDPINPSLLYVGTGSGIYTMLLSG